MKCTFVLFLLLFSLSSKVGNNSTRFTHSLWTIDCCFFPLFTPDLHRGLKARYIQYVRRVDCDCWLEANSKNVPLVKKMAKSQKIVDRTD